ncbi:hypothetical protein OJ996_26330 [Luteolibacter sp. GHJ8]|uniref:Phage protein n=1 Tax=Luteolibacter rhizosphaerae TaxID=2989719 RepID=A0ABT3GBA2_9BACT|nr:hypothetical protein [Luteolibacter rhizosphaerae]MCW1917127.1 hypothetical protein [Luteolibacter rhizosphaerae]
MKIFPISNDTMVVTSTFVTKQGMPILEISHEDDEEGGSLWQFHCGNGDYSMDKMQLVRLDTILMLDPSVGEIADLEMGKTVRRETPKSSWILVE